MLNITPKVNGRYGAPMGRHGAHDLSTAARIHLRRARLDSGGYDAGGAYWGHGQPLYAAVDADGDVKYLRANSRDHAKRIIREQNPDARFFR